MSLLATYITGHVFAFLLIFMRTGIALMLMPGVGDSFVTPQIRLLFALAFSFVLAPLMAPMLPALPGDAWSLLGLILAEACVGLLIGTVMRILITALDIAGMIISMQSGFAAAMMFNPLVQGQGSLIGSLLSMMGVVMIFVTGMHHFMLATVVDSYISFPPGGLPDTGSMIETIALTVSAAFRIGAQLALPFIVIGTVLHVGFGLLGRLMPQVQVFFIALPAQILLSLITLSMVFAVGIMFWLGEYEGLIANMITP